MRCIYIKSFIQITYEYPLTAGLRKPITIILGVMAVFTTAWVVGQLDTNIGKTSQ